MIGLLHGLRVPGEPEKTWSLLLFKTEKPAFSGYKSIKIGSGVVSLGQTSRTDSVCGQARASRERTAFSQLSPQTAHLSPKLALLGAQVSLRKLVGSRCYISVAFGTVTRESWGAC